MYTFSSLIMKRRLPALILLFAILSSITLVILATSMLMTNYPSYGQSSESDTTLLRNNLTIVTQNGYSFSIKKDVWIRKTIEEDPDVIFMQEMPFYPDIHPFGDRGYSLFYEDGIFGPKGGLVIAVKNKTPDVSFYEFDDQGSILSEQITDRLIEKGVLVVRFKDATLIDTHLVSPYTENPDDEEHKNNIVQFNQLLGIIENEMVRNKTIILAGDFNFNNESAQYRQLTGILDDKTTGLGDRAYYSEQDKQMDFIFSNRGSVSDMSINEYASDVTDHKGIVVEFKFPQN